MDLDSIGFYTISEHRCATANEHSAVARAEIVLTDACNFRCPYCRGQRGDLRHHMTLDEAKRAVDACAVDGLVNVRFSGGEPTIWHGLVELVRYTRELGAQRIAISTNGTASVELYEQLISAGVNDFSVSLDACCSSTGDAMSGRVGSWEKVVENIRFLASSVYTTVGVVVTEENLSELPDTVEFAASLGVSDIRVISAAQYSKTVEALSTIPESTWKRFPILAYRIANAKRGIGVRGISSGDSHRCWIALDDIAIAGKHQFPCIIYLREQGNPIGTTYGDMREKRRLWVTQHDTHLDSICRENCLDCIVKCNNRYRELHGE